MSETKLQCDNSFRCFYTLKVQMHPPTALKVTPNSIPCHAIVICDITRCPLACSVVPFIKSCAKNCYVCLPSVSHSRFRTPFRSEGLAPRSLIVNITHLQLTSIQTRFTAPGHYREDHRTCLSTTVSLARLNKEPLSRSDQKTHSPNHGQAGWPPPSRTPR